MAVPSMRATGAPVSASKQTMTAWCVGRSLFSGNRLTIFVVSMPAEGRNTGIAARMAFRSATDAATRGGIDACPVVTSTIADATASTSRSRSSAASTSARESTSTMASSLNIVELY